MKSKFISVLSIILFAVLVSAGAYAASRSYTAVCPSCGEEQVISWNSSKGPLLCIPGAWDASSVLLSYGSLESLLLGKEKIRISSQEPADLRPFLEQRIPVFNSEGKSLGNLLILQGSSILSLHFSVDPKMLSAVNRSKNNEITEGHLTILEQDGTSSFRGELARLSGRGNSTFAYVKKPYEFKLNQKVSPGGMAKGKTWILLANYLDISFLRNQITLDLCRTIGLRYGVDCRQADLWINGEYQGLYLLTEKIQIGKNRLNITDLEEATEAVNDAPLNTYRRFWDRKSFLPLMLGYEIPNDPEDITGGYIAVVEKKHRMDPGSKPCFRTVRSLNVRIKEPTCPSRAQVEYFARLVNQMHQALLAEDGMDPESGRHFSQILDVTSFALKFLVEDLTKDYDIMAGSQYFYKDSDLVDPLIYAGPAWDYDLAYGSMGENPLGAYAARKHTVSNNLWPLLAKHDLFMETVREKWRDTFRPALAVLLGEAEAAPSSPLSSLADYSATVESSAAMDAQRRGTVRKVDKQIGNDFASAVNFLQNWISRRAESLDQLYGSLAR